MKARVIKTGEMVDVYHEPQHGQITNIYKESILVNGRMWIEEELDFCVKANEAPEKIYMTPSFGEPDNVLLASFSKSHLDFHNDIEYTRTDAFIEKACDYLSYHLDTNKIDVNYKFDFIEEFRNYMKGDKA